MMDFPQMLRIRQTFDDTALDDIPGNIAMQLANLKLQSSVKAGQTVAVACSSRGIANYDVIVRAVVSFLKQLKLDPFIIPAMGSHGAATAAGQKRVLQHLKEKSVHRSDRPWKSLTLERPRFTSRFISTGWRLKQIISF